MLTSDQLRVRRSGRQLTPRFLKGDVRKRLLPVATALVAAVEAGKGERREELDARLGAIEHGPRDRIVVAGLTKLLMDRCEFAVPEGPDPVELREALFRVAARRRAQLGPTETFDRDTVLAEAADGLSLAPMDLESRLFVDLRANEVMTAFRTISPEALLDRYDVALVQGVLLRAAKVSVALQGEKPGHVRQLFRAARFHGLLHRVEKHGDDSWLIELDGPMSLFSSVSKYGLQLAKFLPAVLRCTRWRLRADVLWGKKKERCVLELGQDAGLVPRDKRITGVAPELADFVARFRKLDSAWDVDDNDEIIALPGEAVCVPDLIFTNRDTGEEVFLEAFGFWSRQAVWQRIETLQRSAFDGRIILAVGKHLRVSEELLEDDPSGQLYVYKTKMRPKHVLKRLDEGG
ncbi:MAG TPA: DUF790 family protein [Polyangiaceae bacterium]|nr:DUF790 family protein [Polyangiaceae bacterium]